MLAHALHGLLFVLCVYPPFAIALVLVLARRAAGGWRQLSVWFWR